VEPLVFGFQFLSCFFVIWIGNTRINRANRRTLGLIERSYALGALFVFDLINLIPGKYRFVGAFGLTGSTIDTFFGDFICHIKASSKK
jgi:hypothetical protein